MNRISTPGRLYFTAWHVLCTCCLRGAHGDSVSRASFPPRQISGVSPSSRKDPSPAGSGPSTHDLTEPESCPQTPHLHIQSHWGLWLRHVDCFLGDTLQSTQMAFAVSHVSPSRTCPHRPCLLPKASHSYNPDEARGPVLPVGVLSKELPGHIQGHLPQGRMPLIQQLIFSLH